MTGQSITRWLEGLKAGDDSAVRHIWEEYFQKLTRVARDKLRAARRRVADEEDVAISAFESFCRAAADGRFPQLQDRDDLWRLLFTITERKSFRYSESEQRLKRGGGNVHGESIAGDGSGQGFDQLGLASEPNPEEAIAVAETVERLLDVLDDESLRQIAIAKMEGYTNDEIARQLGCSDRSVKRKLKIIRTLWIEKGDV